MLTITRVKLFYIKNNAILNKAEVPNICNEHWVTIGCKTLTHAVYVLV